MHALKVLFSAKRILILLASLTLMLIASACGTDQTAAQSGSSATLYPSATAASTSSPTQATSVAIKTATASVGGKSQTILTDANGLTLYYFTPDTSKQTSCSGGCASTWPPLLHADASPLTTDATLQSGLQVIADTNGQQAEYNGHLLYTYANDQKPGDTTGNGVGGKWFVATPDITKI